MQRKVSRNTGHWVSGFLEIRLSSCPPSTMTGTYRYYVPHGRVVNRGMRPNLTYHAIQTHSKDCPQYGPPRIVKRYGTCSRYHMRGLQTEAQFPDPSSLQYSEFPIFEVRPISSFPKRIFRPMSYVTIQHVLFNCLLSLHGLRQFFVSSKYQTSNKYHVGTSLILNSERRRVLQPHGKTLARSI